MKIDDISEIYDLISGGMENISSRNRSISLRNAALSESTSIKKFAFDTRKIDQETEYNPRRGLQYYNRSEEYITENMSNKLKNLAKLKDTLTDLKKVFGKEREWQDSNARILLSTLDKALRTDQKDGEYTDAQPSVGSIDYIEELLHVRYRLTHDNLSKMASSELKKIILSKDEELTRRDINHDVEITKADAGNKNYDMLIDKLFGGVKVSEDGKAVERTVTITIRDSVIDK